MGHQQVAEEGLRRYKEAQAAMAKLRIVTSQAAAGFSISGLSSSEDNGSAQLHRTSAPAGMFSSGRVSVNENMHVVEGGITFAMSLNALSEFSREDATQPVEGWIGHVTDEALVYGWSDAQVFLAAKKGLNGQRTHMVIWAERGKAHGLLYAHVYSIATHRRRRRVTYSASWNRAERARART